MGIEFDPAKDRANIVKHGVPLARFEDVVLKALLIDDRLDYGEVRYRGWGVLEGELVQATFVIRDDVTRVIGLRRCHEEYRRHVR